MPRLWRRKAASGSDSSLGDDKKAAATGKKGFLSKVKRLIGLGKDDSKPSNQASDAASSPASDSKKDGESDEQANMGHHHQSDVG